MPATLEQPQASAIATATADLDWTDHPLVDRDPKYRRLDPQEIRRLLREGWTIADIIAHRDAREARIADSIRDPFLHEFRLPHWDDVEAMVKRKIVTFVPGGNNPGKSWWSGSLVMRFLLRQFIWPNLVSGKLQVLMIAQDEGASNMFQQPSVYAHFPLKWRQLNEASKKPPGFAKCINYGDKNGFTESNFVLPRPLHGQCWFKTVAQYTRDPKSFEGPAYDLVIIDEGCPLPLFKSLQGRVAKRGGRIIYLLTCLHGYDQTMGQGLEGAKLTKTLPMQWDWLRTPSPPSGERVGVRGQSAPGGINPDILFPELRVREHQTDYLKRIGCPAGHLPYMMQPLNPNWGIIFMWNTFNPFQPRGKWNARLPAMFDACVGQPRWKVLVILFGWIERVGQLALGNFNPEIHVMRDQRREQLDALVKEGKASVYMGSDPETQRSHAVLWLAVFKPSPAYPNGLKYLFDESPRVTEGDWVNANGERGEGQFIYRATGSNWYKRYLRERERNDWKLVEIGWQNLISLSTTVGEGRGDGARARPQPSLHDRIVVRRGDPRGFATEESTATGTRNLFELYLEDHAKEHPDCYPMIFHPAKIRRASTLDIDIIIDLFKYDEDKALAEGGLSAENTPQLLISERCENFIRCALNYTLTDLGKADEDNPYRDFIDALRYLLSSDTPYIDPTQSGVIGGGAWG